MKPVIYLLLCAASTAVAAPAHAGWLDNWFSSQPAGLQCETNESWVTEKNGFGNHLRTTGKCSAIDIKANL
jgi:hypothetical protein